MPMPISIPLLPRKQLDVAELACAGSLDAQRLMNCMNDVLGTFDESFGNLPEYNPWCFTQENDCFAHGNCVNGCANVILDG